MLCLILFLLARVAARDYLSNWALEQELSKVQWAFYEAVTTLVFYLSRFVEKVCIFCVTPCFGGASTSSDTTT